MRRTPTDTATSATDSDAASSSTKPDRKEMRSTRMVSTRYSSVTRRMRAVCRRARPKTRSVDSPSTTSRKPDASSVRRDHCRRCTSCVAQPTSTMKTGITGSVARTVTPVSGSARESTATTIGVARAVRISCGT
ncbi:hypothetical protein CMMCAS03_11955 [Clavibacter michiganensis subsp. michiganensis]|nr:hypothetical protein CMMCAS03_11955 [Clavibacter michiganensis subsp. michiganensis]OUD94939.1 hypothetical protein CMMCAS05_03155 [Clavibacter michiganensis subsp. michiganensis]